jgi:hypothetical protein
MSDTPILRGIEGEQAGLYASQYLVGARCQVSVYLE